MRPQPRAQPHGGKVVRDLPGIEVASAGLSADADEGVTPELLEWAELIFVMEKKHRTKLQRDFRRHLKTERVISLDIPDDYDYMDAALIERLNATVPPHLGVRV